MPFNVPGPNLAFILVAVAGAAITPQLAMSQTVAPAEGIHFRVEGFAGTATDMRPVGKHKGKSSYGLLPSLSFSNGQDLRGQIDLMAASHAGDDVLAAAGHFGVKASEHVTLGVYGATTRFKSPVKLNSDRLGIEAVYQGEKSSFNLIMGNERVDNATVVAGAIPGYTIVDTYGGKDGLFSIADYTYYPKPDWALTLGHRYTGGRHAGVVGAERAYKWRSSTISLFAEGRFGDKAYSGAWVGLRVRFGGDGASLKAIREQEIYSNHLKDDLYGISNSRRRSQVALPPPPPEEEDDDCVCGGCYAQ